MDSKNNWISIGGYMDSDDSEKYTVAFYFTVTTIVTVGYGDVTPKNDAERIFCVILMLIGVISFSFLTSTLTSIITTIDANEAILEEKVSAINALKESGKLTDMNLYNRLIRRVN